MQNRLNYPTYVVALLIVGAMITFVAVFLPYIECETTSERGICLFEGRALLEPGEYDDGIAAGIGASDMNYMALLIVVLGAAVLYTAWRGRGLFTMGAALFNTTALQLWATQFDLQRGLEYRVAGVEYTRDFGWYVLLVGVIPIGVAVYLVNARVEDPDAERGNWLGRLRTATPAVWLALAGLAIIAIGAFLPLDCSDGTCIHAFDFDNFGELYPEDGTLEHFWNGVRLNLLGVTWLLLLAATVYPAARMLAYGPHLTVIVVALLLRFWVSLDNDYSIGAGWPVLILGAVAAIGALGVQWQLKRSGVIEARMKAERKARKKAAKSE